MTAPRTLPASPLRVLFLDFDGVLHPFGPKAGTGMLGPRAVHETGEFCWMPELVNALQGREDVGLVVHSSWRDIQTEAELANLLAGTGVPFLGATPRGDRAESILKWLTAHPAVTDFCILDDQAGKFPRSLKPHLIACPRLKGLSAKPVQKKLQAWLARTPDDLATTVAPAN